MRLFIPGIGSCNYEVGKPYYLPSASCRTRTAGDESSLSPKAWNQKIPLMMWQKMDIPPQGEFALPWPFPAHIGEGESSLLC